MGHIYGMAFCQPNNIFYEFISSFHMPLFMFLSSIGAYVFFCVDMPFHVLVSLNKHIFLPFCMVYIVGIVAN